MAIYTKTDTSAQETIAQSGMAEETYVAWSSEDVKSEWVDGEVIIMSAASSRHVQLAVFLLQTMGLFATHHNLGQVLGPELQLRFSALRRRRVPDVMFVAQERTGIIKDNHVEGAPDLVIEIASPDSVARDWREKYLEYEAAGVREYWVIDPMARHMEAYTLGEDNAYGLIEENAGVIQSVALPEFRFNTGWLWQDPLPNPLEILRFLNVI